MDESGGGREFDVGAIIRKVKDDPDGPSARAARVYAILREAGVTNLDALCFCAEYPASLVGVMDWLKQPARDLIRAVYLAYYVRRESIEWLSGGMEPDSSDGPSNPS